MARMLMAVLWPSFLVAIVAEGVFFSLFEPAMLTVLGIGDRSPLAVYTLGFFFFWAACALASWLACYLRAAPPPSARG